MGQLALDLTESSRGCQAREALLLTNPAGSLLLASFSIPMVSPCPWACLLPFGF